ncbi:MAG: Rieske 2Fe-2S domain-containing protein [Burkholderiales bacterium]
MAENGRLICSSDMLAECGPGVRFEVPAANGTQSAFAVRYRGRVQAYLNRCAHVHVELDWPAGEFFDLSRLYLVCKTHGAAYLPDTGVCIGGPCKGARLAKLAVQEIDGQIFLMEEKGNIHV